MPKGNFKVPYNKAGDLMKSVHRWAVPEEWRANTPFLAKLKLDGWLAPSAVRFKDVDTGLCYPMFLTELVELIKVSEISEGVTHKMHWMVVKKYQDYGIRLAESNEIQG